MDIKKLGPYLHFRLEKSNIQKYDYVSLRNHKYEIAFYRANEFEIPCTFVYISSGKNYNFYILSGKEIIWENGKRQPIDVKQFVARLVNLLLFM